MLLPYYIKNNLNLEIDPSTLIMVGEDTTTRIYYMDYETHEDRLIRNGTPVELEEERLYGSVNSLWADYESFPENLKNAFIAVEDHRFESHNGVDWIRTIGVIVKPSNKGQGGSTITQQLIKNLTDEDDVTVVRKFNESSNENMVDAYNTYTSSGLPPGPICSPGIDAIKAVLWPDETKLYYFCANIETREVYFAETYEQHKENCIAAGIQEY